MVLLPFLCALPLAGAAPVLIVADEIPAMQVLSDNLKAAAAGENLEWTKLYRDFAGVAKTEGLGEAYEAFTQVGKVERILSLQPWYKNGLVYFSTELSDDAREELKHELSRFPKYSHDDILDTLADLFQNEEVFGPVKAPPSMKEMLTYAEKVMLEKMDQYELIFGEKPKDDSWTGLGAL